MTISANFVSLHVIDDTFGNADKIKNGEFKFTAMSILQNTRVKTNPLYNSYLSYLKDNTEFFLVAWLVITQITPFIFFKCTIFSSQFRKNPCGWSTNNVFFCVFPNQSRFKIQNIATCCLYLLKWTVYIIITFMVIMNKIQQIYRIQENTSFVEKLWQPGVQFYKCFLPFTGTLNLENNIENKSFVWFYFYFCQLYFYNTDGHLCFKQYNWICV